MFQENYVGEVYGGNSERISRCIAGIVPTRIAHEIPFESPKTVPAEIYVEFPTEIFGLPG